MAGTLPAGLKYGAAIQAAADANSFSAELLYAIGWIETISVEDWIEATWPGKTAATVVTGTIGEPLPTFYSGIGPVPVAELLTIIVCLAVLFGAPRERSVQETPPTERARMGSARR